MKRIRKARIAFLFISLIFFPFAVSAQMVEGLYQTKVFLNDRSTAELNRGFSEALVKVLIKLTGQSEISSNLPWVRTLIDGAESFIERYSFEPVSEPKVGLNLLATFDKKILIQELKTLEIRQWGSVRPTISFEIAKKQEDSISLDNSDPTYYETINRKAIERGLPVVFSESRNVQPNVGYSSEFYVSNQNRYPGSVEFSINTGVNNVTEVNAVLWFLKETQEFNFIETDSENAVRRLVDLVVDHVAKSILSNVRETKTQDVVLEFFNIKSRQEFERLLAYLSALEQIDKVFVKSIEATSLKLEIFVKGGLKGFEQCVLYSEVIRRTSNRNPLQYNFLDKGK